MDTFDESERTRHVMAIRPLLAAHLYSLDDETLDGVARQAQATLDTPGWQVLDDLLRWRRSQVMDFLLPGDASPQEYARNAGMATGLDLARYALQVVIDIARERKEQVERELRETEEEYVG